MCVLSILSASVVEESLEKKSGGNRTVELLIVSNIDCLTPKKFFLQEILLAFSFLNVFSKPVLKLISLLCRFIIEQKF